MSPEEAREILEQYADSSLGGKIFPVKDVKIMCLNTDVNYTDEIRESDFHIWQEYTFLELIKIAYNLKENDE